MNNMIIKTSTKIGCNHYLGIAVIGNFEINPPNEAISQAVLKLLDDGIHLGKIVKDAVNYYLLVDLVKLP